MAIETLPEPSIPVTTPFRPGLGFLTATPIIAAATICLALVIASAILAPWLAPHDPQLLAPAQRLKPSSAQFLLGTDAYGRDVLSRILYGGRISLLIGLGAAVFSIGIGLVIGYVLIQIFAIDLRLFPVQGFRSIFAGFGPFLERIVLPTCTLSFIYVALIARMTRAAMLDVLGEDYVRTARAKGISETGVLLRHALRNAAVPVITVIGTGFALLISGVVVTESVFNLPGIGRLTVDAVLARDYPVIQAMILLTSGIYVTVNLLIDVAYTLLDPRIRY